MQTAVQQELTPFALNVAEGLTQTQKYLSARYFYDDLGSALFQTITVLPEYGLTRADERLLQQHAPEIAAQLRGPLLVAELGSGDGSKTAHLLRAAQRKQTSSALLPNRRFARCPRCLPARASIVWLMCNPSPTTTSTGLRQVRDLRAPGDQLLLLFLGSTIGNFDRESIPAFLENVRALLRPGDLFLIGADLVKPEATLLAAYDDSLGVTAAFNLNLLRRINRELGGDFDLNTFRHRAIWNQQHRRIEMHLVSNVDQIVFLEALQLAVLFRRGETIWTESSHKFTVGELNKLGFEAGFEIVSTWTDQEWPFAESLWRAC